MPGTTEKPYGEKKNFWNSLYPKQNNITNLTMHKKVKTSLFKEAFLATQETFEIISEQCVFFHAE